MSIRRRTLALTGLALVISACTGGIASGDQRGVLTPKGRSQLIQLRDQRKYQPGFLYAGPDAPEDGPQLVAIVKQAVASVLAFPDGPVLEERVLAILREAVQAVDLFATADRDRTYRYLDEIWAALGFKGNWISRVS